MPFNLVTFTPDGEDAVQLAVELERPFVLRPGLRPDINHLRVSFADFDKLNGDTDRAGTLRLWFSASPSGGEGVQADVTIRNLRIVDVQPREEGRPIGGHGASPAQASARVTGYTLALADFRQAFVAPRGGRLLAGTINPSQRLAPAAANIASDLGLDAGAPELTMPELIRLCLRAMDLADVAIPEGLEAIDPPRGVRWFGNHAPAELAALLDRCGCVFLPRLDGSAAIERIDNETPPDLPQALSLPEQSVSAPDRRGGAIVFSSFPARSFVSRRLEGPSASTWYFVAQDGDEKWKPIEQCQIFTGGAASHVRDGFARVDASLRERARAQAYRFIKLSDDVAPPGVCPVLRRYVAADGSTRDLAVEASIAVRGSSTGRWTNSAAAVRVAAQFKAAGNILQLAARLGRVSGESIDPDKNFVELGSGQLAVRFTTEDAERDPDGSAWKPKYFHVGFRRDEDGSLAALSTDEIGRALAGQSPETLVVSRPDLRLIIVDGEESNREALQASAKAQAAQYLKEPAPRRILCAPGFVPVELSGAVAQVSFDQHHLKTSVVVGHVRAPLHAHEGAAFAHQETYPGQLALAAGRSALGESGETQPIVPLSPLGETSAASPVLFPVSLHQVGGADGTRSTPATWTYNVFSADGQTQLASGLAPEKDRPLNCSMTKATRGTAYQDTAGTLHLWDANERMNQKNCT